jgi:hypothetical protein
MLLLINTPTVTCDPQVVEEERLKVSTLIFVCVLNVLLIAVGHDVVHYPKLWFLSPSLWYAICIKQSFVFKPNNPQRLTAGGKKTPFKLTKERQ